jgi:hypothetical protein
MNSRTPLTRLLNRPDGLQERDPVLGRRAGPAPVRRNKRRSLDLLTCSGWIRLTRWLLRDVHGRFHQPVDRRAGNGPPAWPAGAGYGRAAQLLKTFLDQLLDHPRLHAWVRISVVQLNGQVQNMLCAIVCPAGRSSQVLAYSARVRHGFLLGQCLRKHMRSGPLSQPGWSFIGSDTTAHSWLEVQIFQ